MSKIRTEQGAFTWAAETVFERRAEPAKVARAEAPPATGGGGARRAAGGTVMRVERPRPTLVSPDPLPPDNELWDVRAAARFLKRSVSWVYHRAEDGTLPVRRLHGWGIRFIPAELREWVERSAAVGQRR